MMSVFSRALGGGVGLCLTFILTAGVAQAQLNSGFGSLEGKEKLKVSGCGSDGGFLVADATVANGMWSVSSFGRTYSGSLIQEDSNGRKFTALFDTSSRSLLIDVLTDWAEDICGIPISNIQVEFRKRNLKVNKRMDKAKIVLKMRATGQTSEGTGTAKYKLKLKGPFAGN
jgi:hypothetical protein